MSPSIINTVYSAFSFIGFVLVLIPLPWHLEAWNTGTCLFIWWTASGLLIFFIDSVVWKDNVTNWAPVYCDITTKLIIGLSVGLPAASLTINRRLYKISSMRNVTILKSEKFRNVLIDLAIGLGIPILVMILHYIVQGHRFNIYEEIGCQPATYNTPLAFVLVLTAPVAVGLVSGYFSIRSILVLRETHLQFREILSSHSNLNSGRFYRLMALAAVDVICSVPLTLTFIIVNATRAKVFPWVSWEDTHSNFSRVIFIPSLFWKMDPLTNSCLELPRWIVVICAFTFFAFFGFAEEARTRYRLVANSVTQRMGYTYTGSTKVSSRGISSSMSKYFRGDHSTSKPGNSSKFAGWKAGSIPVFVSQNVVEKHDCPELDSISDLSSINDIESHPGSSPSPIPNSSASQEIQIPKLLITSSSFTSTAVTLHN